MKKLCFITPFVFILCSGLFSCQRKFDKTKWREQGDLKMYTYRESMIKDLTMNYKLTGLSYNQLIDLLGHPDEDSDSNKNVLYYDIITDYGTDIDPIYVKTLNINLDKDSTVIGFKINEWKK